MKEIEIIKSELESLKRRIEEVEEEKAILESELEVYNTERKNKLLEKMNEWEKEFIFRLEEIQVDHCYNDCEFTRYKLCEYNVLLEDFFEIIKQRIDAGKIKQYFEFDKWHK